ncbi:hypothetical protein S7711_11313 [Stachybotrys chartarum IBT 7711]|uniref:Uncharacterized protein n=1 Tax=Stachybotrys chartarum (strain CBS 109288 / IBT 7711) TaxID=1280523 RepID=A0A084AJX2_STACB|nr:hypothetical protein S7711_11313 [Stachybotrys chartarum IBT 7711]KFA46370.1 hypothetical protein S40293_11390 [Stachybotrys chartarum IBT 40293]KFA77049.1 hypothetical protein S40288_10951 [Stachybotrys chartarum IBT 40288]
MAGHFNQLNPNKWWPDPPKPCYHTRKLPYKWWFLPWLELMVADCDCRDIKTCPTGAPPMSLWHEFIIPLRTNMELYQDLNVYPTWDIGDPEVKIINGAGAWDIRPSDQYDWRPSKDPDKPKVPVKRSILPSLGEDTAGPNIDSQITTAVSVLILLVVMVFYVYSRIRLSGQRTTRTSSIWA